MGNFAPVFLAFLQYAFGLYIFKTPSFSGCGPLVSCIIVMFAVFILLWDLRLYPKSLRKLWKSGNFIVQYLIAVVVMEHAMGNVWFPLEIFILSLLPKAGLAFEDLLNSYNWNCDVFCDILKVTITGIIASYLASIIILIGVLHATRAIDLRLLDCGITYFTCDISTRFHNFCTAKKALLMNLFACQKPRWNRKREEDFCDILLEPEEFQEDGCYCR